MTLDKDDAPAVTRRAAQQSSEDAPTAEDVLEEEAQDFTHFAALTGKKNISSQTIRKGAKDFESHGTRAQQDALENSRAVMEEVLSYTRVHKSSNWIRGWYFPDTWAEAKEDEGCLDEEHDSQAPNAAAEQRRPAQVRDRVVVVEVERSTQFIALGRHIPGIKKGHPSFKRLWLLPEEALFLVDRGSMDLWWPLKPLEDICPPISEEDDDNDVANEEEGQSEESQPPPPVNEDDYELGLPLSLQAAYSLLIGLDGERGKISLQKFQVYENLKRSGYHVLRPVPIPRQLSLVASSPQLRQPQTIWQWLISLLHSNRGTENQLPPPHGPLVRPGFYRSYAPLYEQLQIIPRHKPTPNPPVTPQPEDPFKVHYHVWKAGAAKSATSRWTKTRPPPPDFYVAVVDAQATCVPTLEQITALLESTPWDPPTKDKWQGPQRVYPRLKHGHRNVLVAVVDHGIVNYMRFAEGALGEELLYPGFDAKVAPRGGKRGGRGGGRGGRGRGGRRGG